MTRKIKALTSSPDEVLEAAILELCYLRIVEQQAWLDHIPYKDAEEELVVREAHTHLSEPARDILGLVLHYPDEVEDLLNKLPAPNSRYVRTGAHPGYHFNRGRVVTLARRRWGVTVQEGWRIVEELVAFVGTLDTGTHKVRVLDYLT